MKNLISTAIKPQILGMRPPPFPMKVISWNQRIWVTCDWWFRCITSFPWI